MCRDDTDSLSCPEHQQGLVILSATFLSVNTGSNYFYCPALPNTRHSQTELTQCSQTSVSPGILEVCHRHQNCSIKAEPVSLGAPACQALNVFLKVIYACVTRGNIRALEYKNLNTDQMKARTEGDFTTMNSLETQTSPGPATNTVNTGIIEALIEEEEDNEARLDLQTRVTDKKLIFSSELKLEPQSDRDQVKISWPTPDRPADNPDDSGEHSFQVWKIFCSFYIKY